MGGKKKKGGKKGKKDEKEPEDGLQLLRYEQLQSEQKNLQDQLDEAKIKRNMLQIEKDMIHDFYHNTREEIKELEAKVRNFDTKM